MISKKKKIKLRKELKLFDVFAIAAGTTLSAGFFLLPGLAAEQAGSAIVLAYLIAAIPLIPAMFSIIELNTAMPKAGGMYYSLDRTLGPMFGTIGGVGTWLALVLKVSFALIGMGAYISIFLPSLNIQPIAIALALILGALNLFSAKKTGKLQVFLVVGLLILLAVFIGYGIPEVHYHNFQGMFDVGSTAIMSTAGMVYISYVGVTNVASLSEEIKNPERNLPLGVILALTLAIIIYFLGTSVMVGVLPKEELAGNLTPVSAAAKYFLGDFGAILLAIAAILAFVSVANAGTMSASRYPMAMSRDFILPHSFKQINKFGTPTLSIIVTVSIILLILIFLDPIKIAKLASAFQLLLYGLICVAVIVMRESRIEAYDPGFKSPFYPWMQIFGVFSALWLIGEMGIFSILFSLGLIVAGFLWYWFYAKDKVQRNGAIYHIFERLGKYRYEGLDVELRGILKEKGLRKDDPFDQIITRSWVLDLKDDENDYSEVVKKVSHLLAQTIDIPYKEIKHNFMEGTQIGATPVINGVALPHFRSKYLKNSEMVLVRSKKGIHINCNNPILCGDDTEHIVFAMFFLVSSDDKPRQHLRILAQIADRVEDDSFTDEWFNAESEQELKETLLHDDRFVSITIAKNTKSETLINSMLREVHTPVGSLVAMLQRGSKTLIPNGSTVLEEGDRLTVIGSSESLSKIREMYLD